MEGAEVIIHPKSIEVVVKELDKTVEGKPGIKPSEAWQYREEVKAKYGLPENDYMWDDPVRYINEMETLLKEKGVNVRYKHEFETFFRENPTAEALTSGPSAFSDARVIVQGARDDDWLALRARAKQLSHEGVHGLQAKKYPRMPEDIAEKEAYYYQILTPQWFMRNQDDPEFVMTWINEDMEKWIQGSVETDTKLESS